MDLDKDSDMYTISKCQQNIIIINDKDSDYETSSSNSTSPQPQCDPSPETNKTMPYKVSNLSNGHFRPGDHLHVVYVCISINSNIIEPWTEAILLKNHHEVIVLDDDDDAKQRVQPYKIIDLTGEREVEWMTVGIENKEFRLPEYAIADYNQPRNILKPGTRIIAKFQRECLPYLNLAGKIEFLVNDMDGFYPGIVSHTRYYSSYMVFFDNGLTQYVPAMDIRRVFGDFGHKYGVHSNAKEFYNYYFNIWKLEKLPEITPIEGMSLWAYLAAKECWRVAKVVEIDEKKPYMVKLHFPIEDFFEWLYVGSPRIKAIGKFINTSKPLEKYNPNVSTVELSSGSEDENDVWYPREQQTLTTHRIAIQTRTIRMKNSTSSCIRTVRHSCSSKCIGDEKNSDIANLHSKTEPLYRPIICGWIRVKTKSINGSSSILYTAPCGRKLTSIKTVYKHLKKTKSKLSIDCFTFEKNVDCAIIQKTVCEDGSPVHFLNVLIPGGNKEKMEIPVISITGNLPQFKEYVTHYHKNPRSKKLPDYLANDEETFRSSCDCEDNCADASKCACIKLTLESSKCASTYKYKRLLNKVDTGIYECNSGCKCNHTCLNRLVTAQVEQRLEIFETKDRGYGVRCQTDLPKGAFVCCYFGDLLHGTSADLRGNRSGKYYGDEYFMQLDHIETAEVHKDGYEANAMDVNESDINSDSDNTESSKSDDIFSFSDSSDTDSEIVQSKKRRIDEDATEPILSHEFQNMCYSYFPITEKQRQQDEINQRTLLFGKKEVEFVVDGRFRGNLSRFFNHSCAPNLFSQTVFKDTHDLRFPWLAFFTSKVIKAGTELTWDYNYNVGSVPGREIECLCATKVCRKRLL